METNIYSYCNMSFDPDIFTDINKDHIWQSGIRQKDKFILIYGEK